MESLIVPALIASTAVTAYGLIQQGRAADIQSKAEEDILNYNAEQKRKEAAEIQAAAQAEADKFAKEARRFRGTQRVAIARGGVLVTGTPAYLLEETAQNLEADRLEILKQGYLQSDYAMSEAYGMRFAATSARARGKNISRGAYLQAGGTLLQGYGTIGMYQNQAVQTQKYGTISRKDYSLAKKHGLF